jgi:hypothetical protein
MKTLIISIFIMFAGAGAYAQQWVQTASIPEGAGVTDMVITSQGTLIVTTASYSSIAGTLGGVRRSTNEGALWENPLSGFNGRTLHLGENGVVFASFWPYPLEEGLYRSTNDGVNWTRLHYVNSGDNIFSITSKNDNNMIFIGTRNGVQRSTNAGANWSYVNNGIPANSWVRDIETDTSTGIVLAATTKGVFSTTNNGTSWQMTTGIDPQDTVVKIRFDYSPTVLDYGMGTRASLGTLHGELYDAFDDTEYLLAALIAVFEDDELTGIGFIALKILNQRFYGVCQFSEAGNLNESGGFFLSTNGGPFKTNNTGLPNQTRPSALTLNSTIMRGETTEVNFFLGSFENTIDGAKVYKLTYLVGIQLISSEIPEGFKLKQNYPNPFNPVTKINFDLPFSSNVTIKVFDITGREIATLVNDFHQAGSYNVTFDAMNISSGVYFYRIEAGGFVQTKRMVLLR